MYYLLTSLGVSHDSCASLEASHGAGQVDGDLDRDSPLNILTKLDLSYEYKNLL